MNIINNYNDYMLDFILEKVSNDELVLVLSDELVKLLMKIDHDIAERLLLTNYNQGEKFKITLLDIDDDPKNFDKFTFLQSNKVLDIYNKYMNNVLGKNRPSDYEDASYDALNNQIIKFKSLDRLPIEQKNKVVSTIGRVINKLFPDEFPNAGKKNSIESFVDKVKAERTKELGVFKLVEGEDLVKYYNIDNYDTSAIEGTSLGSSCMRYSKCSGYMNFYVKNNIKLLVLMSNNEDDKIIGRAIVWMKVSVEDGEHLDYDMTFMDRIYTTQTSDIEKFKNYAKKNGWLFKSEQNRNPDEYIYNPTNNQSSRLILTVKDIIKTNSYPYLDTIKYLNPKDNTITNNNSNSYNRYMLESVRGGYIFTGDSYIYNSYSDSIEREEHDDDDDNDDNHEGDVWSDEEDRYVNEDDARYSQFCGSWASSDYADDHWTYCENEDDYIPNDDTVEIGKDTGDYCSKRYADRHFKFCDMDDTWYPPEDVVWSDKQGNIPKDETVDVYIDIEKIKSDYRIKDDDYITYINEDGESEYYDGDILGDQFVRVKVSIDDSSSNVSYKKDEEDKRFFKWGYDYYIIQLKDELIGQTKLDL